MIIAHIQNDSLPGGTLGVRGAHKVIPVLLKYIDIFYAHHLSLLLTHDRHPPTHCSFLNQGGPWPMHCVADTPGSLPGRWEMLAA